MTLRPRDWMKELRVNRSRKEAIAILLAALVAALAAAGSSLSCAPSLDSVAAVSSSLRPHFAALRQRPAGAVAVSAAKPREGTSAPDFEFPAVSGDRVRLSNLRGKVVLVEFTATWCPACNEAAALLRELRTKYAGSPVSILSVSLDGGENTDTTIEDVHRFLKRERVDWPVLFDDTGTDNAAALAYGVTALPAYVVIDQRGMIRLSTRTRASKSDLTRAIESLLGEPRR
jgi:peroxiredoxin